ncbi:MAG TPA: helix-turn-helix domain-containing protein [Blastocatellia bacterium]|nr:helix-turn-helix domain-containing protein [Blastocatellia bacterium]
MLTTKEAAEELGAAERSVRLWAKQGRFPGATAQETPRGPYWLIPESALVGFEMSKPGPKPGAKKAGKKGTAK